MSRPGHACRLPHGHGVPRAGSGRSPRRQAPVAQTGPEAGARGLRGTRKEEGASGPRGGGRGDWDRPRGSPRWPAPSLSPGPRCRPHPGTPADPQTTQEITRKKPGTRPAGVWGGHQAKRTGRRGTGGNPRGPTAVSESPAPRAPGCRPGRRDTRFRLPGPPQASGRSGDTASWWNREPDPAGPSLLGVRSRLRGRPPVSPAPGGSGVGGARG